MKKIRCTGASGVEYTFDGHSIGTDFEAISACYVFAKEAAEGEWIAIYVGKTEDLSERFHSHHAMPCVEKHGATHIFIDTSDMDNI